MDESSQVGDRRTSVDVAVASSVGVVVVRVGGDRVGEFGLRDRCTARDVAAADGRLAVATPEDVRVDGEPTGFGPAAVVGAGGDGFVAVGPEGRVARRPADGDAWTPLGRLDAAARAADGDLLATAAGVVHCADGLDSAGLDDARDVAAGTYAATGDGLYRRDGTDWRCEHEGAVDAVAAAGGRAHAASGETLFERRDGAWRARDLPTAVPVADVGHGPETVYAVTADGTFLADAGEGWRTRPLGVPDVRRLAVLGASERKRI
jgi:hypothetical protein